MAPQARLEASAASAGVQPRDLVAVLGRLGRRGRCADLASRAVLSPASRREAATWWLCPPPAMRHACVRVASQTADKMSGMSAWTARNVFHPAATRREMAVTARSPDGQTRRLVAQHPHCPPVMLRRLACDPLSSSRVEAAHNPRFGPDLAALLADDPDPSVRAAVGARASAWAKLSVL